jgi:LysM repeat protein
VLGIARSASAASLASGSPDVPDGDPCKYTVKSGDTLGHIAARHDISQKQLLSENASLAGNPDRLKLGQTLDVCVGKGAPAKPAKKAKDKPADDADADSTAAADDAPPVKKPPPARCGKGGIVVAHEVVQGDTLEGIALQYDVRESEIIGRNSKVAENRNLLRLGQIVKVCVEPDKDAGKSTADKAAAAKSKAQADATKKAKECGMETPLFKHEVVPGEHLGQIAGRYGVRKSDLLKLNPSLRANPDKLGVGQTIKVCPEIAPRERNKIKHTVKSGENLGSIAHSYGLSPNELFRFQQGKLPDRNALREGQALVVWADGRIVRGFGGRDTDTGVLAGGMQLTPGKHYVVKWDAAAWGTTKTVRAIQTAISEYKRRHPKGPKVHVGDISKRGGGKFPPHISHQHGRDVDMGYVLTGKDADETKFRGASAKNLDVAKTWALIKAFVDTDEVTYIFMDYRIQKLLYEYALEHGVKEETLDELFQYPRGRGRSHGIIRHWKGHSNHFHVRFRP